MDAATPRTDKSGAMRTAARRTKDFTRKTAHRIDGISRAEGAEKSGLRTLIWSNCVSMGADALITVYLAATLFFAAPGEQQRSNVALYLLVTVAPFAVIAPVIGPLLDRIDRGRRIALASTFVIRAVLCYLLAVHTDSTVVLYICALLALVFSRAYHVLKAAVVPRVLPEEMPLVKANSRLTVFGMVGAGVLGGIGAGIIKVFNSLEPVQTTTSGTTVASPTLGFTIELIVGALVFLAGAWVSMQLPQHVDTDEGEGKVAMTKEHSSGVRILLGTHVLSAIRSASAQRFLGGFLSFFMVFYVQSTMTGFGALAVLGALGAAAGVGSVVGTSIGSQLTRSASPDNLVLVATGVAVACCILAAITPGVTISIIVALITAVASALGKMALDAIIQREVPGSFRSSAFSRSETWLQLSWVAGGTVGILLPTNAGTLWLGWLIAAVILGVAFALILLQRHKDLRAGPQAPAMVPRAPHERRLARLRALARRKRGATPHTAADQRAPHRAPPGNAGDQWLDQAAPRPTRRLPDFAEFREPPPPPRKSHRP
ncbi:hypothetical protein GCM10027298_02750 [Epidermidibacterium keratini]